jgi:hypothetical protein
MIKQKDNEIKKLKNALKAFISDNESVQPCLEHSNTDSDTTDDSNSEDDEENGIPEPIVVSDTDGDLYFCTACAHEVVDGECTCCGLKHQWKEVSPSRLPPSPRRQTEYAYISQGMGAESASTNTQAVHQDRSLVRRGNTPLPFFPFSECTGPPANYTPLRVEEYIQLRRRGATRLMCETFDLEFSDEKGIFAHADTDLYEEFAGPRMRDGDVWKIHLGRRISLDEDDLDGSEFIEGLIEDALLFPLRRAVSKQKSEIWETEEESPGIWVTKLKAQEKLTVRITDEDEDDEAYEDVMIYYQKYDDELVKPPTEDVPVHLKNYMFDHDDDLEGDKDAMEEDPGYAWHPATLDGVWPSSSDEEDQLDQEEGTSTLDGDQDMDSISSDSADSDFDDEEVSTEDESS